MCRCISLQVCRFVWMQVWVWHVEHLDNGLAKVVWQPDDVDAQHDEDGQSPGHEAHDAQATRCKNKHIGRNEVRQFRALW